MSQIMNHREIEYFTNQYWKTNGQTVAMVKDMGQPDKGFHDLMNWLEQTQKEVLQEDLAMDYGLDCIRCYLLFEKTPKAEDPWFDTWDEGGLEGVYKFVSKYRRMIMTALHANQEGFYADLHADSLLHEVESIQKECQAMMKKENTMPNRHNILAILMECVKTVQKELKISEITVKEHAHEIEMAVPLQEHAETEKKQKNAIENVQIYELCKKTVLLMAPFMPYISEELWQMIQMYETGEDAGTVKWYLRGQKSTSVLEQKWTTDGTDAKMQTQLLQIPVQVNARTKRTIRITTAMTAEQVEELARKEIQRFLLPDIQYRVIYVTGKLVNFVEQHASS